MVTDITTILKYLNSAFSRIPLKSLTYMFKNKAALLKIQKIPYRRNIYRHRKNIKVCLKFKPGKKKKNSYILEKKNKKQT